MSLRAPAGRNHSRARATRLLVAGLLLMPLLAAAQPLPIDPESGRNRLRDRYRGPQNNQKLEDNVRKLNSDDLPTRIEGVAGLGEVNDPKAIEHLVTAASDSDMRVRVKAIEVLGQIRAKEATPLLIQQLFMRDTDLATKRRILASLGKIGDSHATKSIVEFMSRDIDPDVRGNAIFALGDIGDTAALPALESVATGQNEMLRGLAQDAIRKIRARPEPAVVPPALASDRRGRTAAGR